MQRLSLFNFPVDPLDLDGVVERLESWMGAFDPHTVITLNPEIVIQAEEEDAELAQVIRGADLVSADGVGIVWAVKKMLDIDLPGRASGIDIVIRLMERQGPNLRVFFLGGKPGIAEQAAKACAEKYNVQIAGYDHGYFKDDGNEDLKLVEKIRAAYPHLLITSLGAGRQEKFNHRHRNRLRVPIMIGAGGTLDVLSGTVERAPEWTQKMKVEWAYRILGDRKRWNRFPRLMKFAMRVQNAKPIEKK